MTPGDPSEDFAWLAGTWRSAAEEGVTTSEVWWTGSGSLQGIASRSDDPEPLERLEILVVEGVVVYRAHPRGQASHDFPLISTDGTTATFADPKHDFPQHLTYRRTGDRLEITAQGVVDGQAVVSRWALERE